MNIFNVGNGSVNIYLLDSGTHRLLIDTGFPGTLNDLGRRLRQTGHKVRDIDYLLVTHFHVDHAGMVQELKETLLEVHEADGAESPRPRIRQEVVRHITRDVVRVDFNQLHELRGNH